MDYIGLGNWFKLVNLFIFFLIVGGFMFVIVIDCFVNFFLFWFVWFMFNFWCIVFGDVYGYFDVFIVLFEAIVFNERDGVYFVGDLIDWGLESVKVVDFVMENKYYCLLGNYE